MKTLFLFFFCSALMAADIDGYWKSINETTGKPQCVVAVYEYDGLHYGRIIGTYDPNGVMTETIYNPKGRAPGILGNPFYCGMDLIWALDDAGSKFKGKIVDPEKFVVAGPQADIGQQYWGSLYGERFGGMMKASPPAAVKEAVKPADWNDYSIKCVGKHVTITINGTTMVDDNFEKMPDDGIIAWQLHQGFKSMEVTFKDIKFKDLSAK